VGRSLPRQMLPILALSVGIFAACAWPAHAWGGRAGLAALGTAAGICFIGALVARVAGEVLRRLDSGDDAGPRAVQAQMGVRMLVTLAISLPVLFIEPFPRIQFGVWLAANYLLHLALEVFVSLRDLGQNHGPSQGGPPPAADLSDSPTRDASSPGAAQE